MSAVRTYKALDYPMKLYGFWPADLAAVALVFIVLHGLTGSFMVDLCLVGPAAAIAWRARRRPACYGASLVNFVFSPARYGVGLTRERRG